MKLYISGRMTGMPDFNYPAFHSTAKKLRDMGHEVLNPAENFGGSTEHPDGRKAFMRKDIEHVLQADALVMLDGWRSSPGATLEKQIAEELRLEIMDESLNPIKPEDVLDEAKRLTSLERNNSYGPPDQDFARTAKMWSAILDVEVSNKDVALCMIALKLSRAVWSEKRDHATDIAGYARCWAVCAGIHGL